MNNEAGLNNSSLKIQTAPSQASEISLVKNLSFLIQTSVHQLDLKTKILRIDLFHPTTSAPVIKHPTLLDGPAYKVQVIQPTPKPLQINHTVSADSALATLFASDTHTSEPLAAELFRSRGCLHFHQISYLNSSRFSWQANPSSPT